MTSSSQLPATPPERPESFDAILADLDRIILPGLSLWQHPRFFGYFPANASLASVLGDFVSTGLGVLGLAWQSSPALTELEEVATGWLRQMVGLSAAWSGVIQDTASASTLVALLARERRTGYSLARGGLQAESQPLTVYASSQSHSSVDKAAVLAGFGRENIRHVAHDADYAMRPDALDDRHPRRYRVRQDALCGGSHDGHHHDDGHRSGWRDCRRGKAARHLGPCRCGNGRLSHDPARMSIHVGGDRGGGLDRA